MKITGQVEICLYNEYGLLLDQRSITNLVVTTGKSLVAALISGTGTVPSHIAVGTSASPSLPASTTLVAELTRVACGLVDSSGAVAHYQTTFGAGVGTGTLQEAGLFNSNSGGTMMSRIAFGAITKGAADTMIVNWYLTVN